MRKLALVLSTVLLVALAACGNDTAGSQHRRDTARRLRHGRLAGRLRRRGGDQRPRDEDVHRARRSPSRSRWTTKARRLLLRADVHQVTRRRDGDGASSTTRGRSSTRSRSTTSTSTRSSRRTRRRRSPSTSATRRATSSTAGSTRAGDARRVPAALDASERLRTGSRTSSTTSSGRHLRAAWTSDLRRSNRRERQHACDGRELRPSDAGTRHAPAPPRPPRSPGPSDGPRRYAPAGDAVTSAATSSSTWLLRHGVVGWHGSSAAGVAITATPMTRARTSARAERCVVRIDVSPLGAAVACGRGVFCWSAGTAGLGFGVAGARPAASRPPPR